MTTPRVTEKIATVKANRKEFRKSIGTVAGMVMVKARVQFDKVHWPCAETGESDQKLPRTRAEIGTKTMNARMAMRSKEALPMALSVCIGLITSRLLFGLA